jgi:hypothetical protein
LASSAGKFSPARIAHSRISLLKNVSLIALQQQEAILDIWITVHLDASKKGETLFWASRREAVALEALCIAPKRRSVSPRKVVLQRLIVAGSTVYGTVFAGPKGQQNFTKG